MMGWGTILKLFAIEAIGLRHHLLDTMEETLLQWNRLLKIDRSRKHANEVHVCSAFEWEILRSKMSHSI